MEIPLKLKGGTAETLGTKSARGNEPKRELTPLMTHGTGGMLFSLNAVSELRML
jgi:hypothetical protein